MCSIHGVFVVRIFIVMSYILLGSKGSLHSLTLRSVVSHQIKRTHNREGDRLQFVTICSTAVEYFRILVIYAIRKCPSNFVQVFVVFIVEEYKSLSETFWASAFLVDAILT